MAKEAQIIKKYPKHVVLRFRSQEELEVFMGQLSDGWGENLVDLDWDSKEELSEDGQQVGVKIIDDIMLDDIERKRQRANQVR
jgi:hypothetical protein